jgi:hypothetical protein
MGRWRRRTLTTVTAVTAVLALSASSALAHHCYNDARSATGNQQAARSPVLMPVSEFIDLIADWEGICLDGRTHMQDWAEDEDVADKLVHMQATMAAGAEYLSPNGYRGGGIAFLPFEVVLEAFEICGLEP